MDKTVYYSIIDFGYGFDTTIKVDGVYVSLMPNIDYDSDGVEEMIGLNVAIFDRKTKKNIYADACDNNGNLYLDFEAANFTKKNKTKFKLEIRKRAINTYQVVVRF